MRSVNKIISIFLALSLMVSVLAVGVVPAAAETEIETYAQQTVQGSAILHCFDWSYNSIKAALPDIAAAGYTAVQTSPVQPPKDYSASYTDTDNQWWKLYQPLDLAVANGGTWLGTKAELTAMCTEAERYGIKVIVDIVANHVANKTGSGGYEQVNASVASDLQNANYYHSFVYGGSSESRRVLTQNPIGMPDLNTQNSYIQQKALGLLEDCINCGVDGFRFDTAKHIELPTDQSAFSGQFWPVVIDGAKSYADDKNLPEPFFYGEILNSAGDNFPISNYTKYMAVTDNRTGDRALDKAYWSSASELADGTYLMGAGAEKSVLWVESHDTYMGSTGSAWTQNTKDVTNDVLIKAWAIVGARADSTALFFARPNSIMGAASTDTTWKSEAVAEVNKFKNHFDGTNEYLSSSGSTAYIERGTKGVVISKLDGAGSVSLTAHQMKSGTYTDQVTGNTFTVSGGKITGNVGSTGVAVVYDPDADLVDYLPGGTLYLRPGSEWTQSGGRCAMYVYNSVAGGDAWVSMTSAGNNDYSAEVPAGQWTNVIFCLMNGEENNWDNKTAQTGNLFPDDGTNCYSVAGNTWSVYGSEEPEQPEGSAASTESPSDTITVYAYNGNNWNNMNVYYWGNNIDSGWPGIPMQQGRKVFKAEIPGGVSGIIFNDGSGSQTENIESGIADNAQWYITNNYDSGGRLTVNAGPTYYLVGTMTSWNQQLGYAFTLNTAESNTVEYKLSSVTLPEGEVKVNDTEGGWYPDKNVTVSSAGTYDVYFRPNGDGTGEGWEQNSIKLVHAPCTVTWKNDDGTLLATETVAYGATPVYSGAAPTKEATDQYTYSFSGWSPTPAAVTEDVTYTAQFTESPRTFTVTWKNWDGSVLETDKNVVYGSRPAFNSDTPTRAADGDTTYQFSSWSPQITDETVITEDTTYTARFVTNTKTYTITWIDGDGNTLRTESCIEGLTPHYTGSTPTKTATAQYTYTFKNSWTPGVIAADNDAIYTADFDATLNEYTITFKDSDGTELQSTQVGYGATPAYTGEIPSKEPTLTTKYTFSGWTPEVSAVTGEATYTAAYTESPVGTYTVKATNVVGWNNVYVYYWGHGGDNQWPGAPMTADSEGFIYTASVPETAEGIIFNDGNAAGVQQTVNIESGISDGAHWAILDKRDSGTNNYSVNPVPTYYLVGTMTDWETDGALTLTPVRNDNRLEEYKLDGVRLEKDTQIKIFGSNNTWFPDGNNYKVEQGGVYDLRFRPNGDGASPAEGWENANFSLVNKYIAGHTLSLNGDIGVNFYFRLDQITGATVEFSWTSVNGVEKTASGTPDPSTGIATVKVAPAEMTVEITAALKNGDQILTTDTYSAVQYAHTILNDDAFAASYVEAENNKGKDGAQRLIDLRALVNTMLIYGADAQRAFNVNTDNLADAGISYNMEPVTADKIHTGASDMTAGLSQYGLTYAGSTVVYLSETSLRHYFEVTDRNKFNEVKDSVTFNDEAVEPVRKDGKIYFQMKDIGAADLDTLYTLKIGSTEYQYSVLDYVKACLASSTVKDTTKQLVQATYRYNEAANTYFG